MLHGGLGTGKSHVITLLRELFGELGWQQGVHYQVVVLQAVMAQLISGDTIHHACGIKAFKKGAEYDDGTDSQQIIAKRVLQWRWLIIDEISMVSAKLLAELDMKLRGVVRDLAPPKKMNGTRQDHLAVSTSCVAAISGNSILLRAAR